MNLLQARLVGANRVASANCRVTHRVEGGSQPKGPGSAPVAAARIKTYFAACVHRNKALPASPNLHPQETLRRRASRRDASIAIDDILPAFEAVAATCQSSRSRSFGRLALGTNAALSR
jgi:hypothetical protein